MMMMIWTTYIAPYRKKYLKGALQYTKKGLK